MVEPISDIDAWRAANLLIREYGDDAEIEAARLADLMLDRGDRNGQLIWMRIDRRSDPDRWRARAEVERESANLDAGRSRSFY